MWWGIAPLKSPPRHDNLCRGNEQFPFNHKCTCLYGAIHPSHSWFISLPVFEQLQDPACLINVARGKVQVEADILKALDKGLLEEALDVLKPNPCLKTVCFGAIPRWKSTPYCQCYQLSWEPKC